MAIKKRSKMPQVSTYVRIAEDFVKAKNGLIRSTEGPAMQSPSEAFIIESPQLKKDQLYTGS